MYNRKNIAVILIILFSLFTSISAQQNDNSEKDFEEIAKLYDVFETSVKNKDKAGLESLFLHNTVPVAIIGNSPDVLHNYYSTFSNWWANYVVNLDHPMELRISNIESEKLAEGIIITKARFDQFENNAQVGYGIDLFTYIKTGNGWKMAALHNTYTDSNDSTDYSIPFKFENKPSDFPAKLEKAVEEKNKNEFLKLFHNSLYPYFSFRGEFNQEFLYPAHSVAGAAERLPRIPYKVDVDFSNVKTKIYDNYMAVLTMDFNLKFNGEERANGKQVWLLYATSETGWKLSSVFQALN